MKLINHFNDVLSLLDLPTHQGLYFQEPANQLAEELILFHDQMLFIGLVTTVSILWALSKIILKPPFIALKHILHGTLLEVVWTLLPSLIVILIAIPSFRLLYLSDEMVEPSLTVKAIGSQWYWNYEYSDFWNTLEFDSYAIYDEDLNLGQIRLLEVDNRLVLPTHTKIRLITTAFDVIHCFAVPSLAIRIDSIPGRINLSNLIIEREGVFRGICAELCGAYHLQMPIVIDAVSSLAFFNWINKELESNS